MAVDLTKIAFDSRLNYLKRDGTISGSQVVALTAGTDETITINHNLGYIPFYTVAATISDDSIIWSNNISVRNYAGTVLLSDPTIRSYATTTQLVITYINNLVTNTKQITGNRTVYYNIYLDYENA